MVLLSDIQANLNITPIQGKIGFSYERIMNIARSESDTIPRNTSKEIKAKFRKKILVVCDGNGNLTFIDLNKSQSKRFKEKYEIYKKQLQDGEITKEEFDRYLRNLNEALLHNHL